GVRIRDALSPREHAAPGGGSAWPDPVPGGGGRRPEHGGVLPEPEGDTVKGAPVVTARLVALTRLTAAVAWRSAGAQVGGAPDCRARPGSWPIFARGWPRCRSSPSPSARAPARGATARGRAGATGITIPSNWRGCRSTSPT